MPLLSESSQPRLAPGCRWGTHGEQPVVLFPEGMIRIQGTGKDILELCDGQRALQEIVATLTGRYGAADPVKITEDVSTPAARSDLKDLIVGARQVGLYTNLITSGIGVSETQLAGLVDAGLDHIQLSFQDSTDEPARWIAGAKGHAYKVDFAQKIRQHQVAFTVNLVVHRQNLDHIEEMVEFIEQLQPERIEIANAQYYGWALKNRAFLLPTPRKRHTRP